jgi:hypothetical protein
MHHMSERHLTVRHLKLVIVVYLIGKAYNGVHPNRTHDRRDCSSG